jgi:hypothetical protein
MQQSNSRNKYLLYGLVIGLVCLLVGYYLGVARGLNKLPSTEQEVYFQEAMQQSAQKQERYFNEMSEVLPQNPTQATATCRSTGAVISSGVASNCPDPVFTWSGASGKGKEINGYLVYWYESTAPLPETVVTENSVVHNEVKPPLAVQTARFAPWRSDLTPGKSYNLMVQVQTDAPASLAQTGGVVTDEETNTIQNAEVLFVYNYTN